MPSDSPKLNGRAYLPACDRALDYAVQLVHARGITANVDIDPGRAPFEAVPDPHQIRVTYQGKTRTITDYFPTLALHQLKATIDELAASA